MLTVAVCLVLGLARSPILSSSAGEQPPLIHEIVVSASVDEAWDAFTSAKAQEAWNVAHCEFELKVGGKWRTHYGKNGVLGDDGSIEHTILSFDPRRMISFQIAKMPKTFPFKESFSRVWHVLYFESLEPKKTKITLKGLGYGDDEESKRCRAFFERGNATTFENLRKYLERR